MLKRDIQGKFALKNDDYRQVRSLRLKARNLEGSRHSGRVLRVYPSRLLGRNGKKQPFAKYYTGEELKSTNGFPCITQ